MCEKAGLFAAKETVNIVKPGEICISPPKYLSVRLILAGE